MGVFFGLFTAGSHYCAAQAVPQRLLVITASLSEVKAPYSFSRANPNRILQSLLAIQTGLQIPFVCTESHELGEEIVAAYLYQVHLYPFAP
jgi:hypothetical protein